MRRTEPAYWQLEPSPKPKFEDSLNQFQNEHPRSKRSTTITVSYCKNQKTSMQANDL